MIFATTPTSKFKTATTTLALAASVVAAGLDARAAVGMEESILHNEFERCEYDFRVFVVFVTVSLSGVDFENFIAGGLSR